MMYGGKVELRTPFLNKALIDFGLRIPTKYRDENGGKGRIMKYVLRKHLKVRFQMSYFGDLRKHSKWDVIQITLKKKKRN